MESDHEIYPTFGQPHKLTPEFPLAKTLDCWCKPVVHRRCLECESYNYLLDLPRLTICIHCLGTGWVQRDTLNIDTQNVVVHNSEECSR